MRLFWSPDGLGFIALALILLALIAVLAVTAILGVREAYGWLEATSIALPVGAFVFHIFSRWTPLREFLYRQWYKVFGPSYTIRARGLLWVAPSRDSSELLETAVSVVRKWRDDAKVKASLGERAIVTAGPRTLIIDVPQQFGADSSEDESEDEERVDQDKYVTLELRGYDEKLSRVLHHLDNEIAPLLERFSVAMMPQGNAPQFTLDIQIKGENPMLRFYLRDVPAARVENFQLRVSEEESGIGVYVTFRDDELVVTSTSPGALLRSARRYLTIPALNNRN